MRQRSLVRSTSARNVISLGRVESQYLVGSFSPSPLDQQPLLRSALGELVVMMRGTNAHAGKARGQLLGRAFAPRDRAPGALGQIESKLLDRDRSMLVVAANELRLSPAPRPLLRRQRSRTWRPHRS